MKESINYLEHLLKEKDTCVIALSGGPDSMCLLHFLLEIQKQKKIKIIAIHINHNTRPSCEEEARFIANYLKEYDVTLEYHKIESYKKEKFTENEARTRRYEVFKQIVKKCNANYLFTAHHVDDLTETIIMRILRGSTLEGYAGFKQEMMWDEVKIIRPLIYHTKKEILEYLEGSNIPYVIDESNQNDIYLRNKIRHNILPVLETIEPNYQKKILKFRETLEEANSIIEEKIEEEKQKVVEKNKLKKQELLKQSIQIQKEVLKDYLKKYYQEDLGKITDKHLQIILEFIKNQKETSSVNLPSKTILKKDKNYIWLTKEKKCPKYRIKLEEKVILPNESIVKKRSTYEQKSNYEIHLNSKEITLPLYLTTRSPGMKIEVKNLKGTKKVSDILINSKVPREKKDEIPILIDSNGVVLWIPGIKKSKYDLEKNENYDIIYQYIKKEGLEEWKERIKIQWKTYFLI